MSGSVTDKGDNVKVDDGVKQIDDNPTATNGVNDEVPQTVEGAKDTALDDELHEDTHPEDDELQDGNVRKRTQTDKGKEYKLHLYRKGLKYSASSWRTALCEAEQVVSESSDLMQLRPIPRRLNTKLREVATAYDQLKSIGIEDDDGGHELYENVERQTQDCIIRVSRKVNELELETGSVRTHKTSLSSHTSKASSRRSSKMEAAADAAALKASLKFVDIEAQTEAELKKLRILREIDVANARYSAMKEATESDILNPEMDKPEIKPTIDAKLNPSAHVYIPKVKVEPGTCDSEHSGRDDVSSDGNDFNKLAKMFAEQVNLGRIPPPEPGTFSGDPLAYSAWRAAFEVLVSGKNIPHAEKLHYLKKYLTGEAKDAVEGFFIHMTDNAYQDAMNLLQKRYGDKFIVSNAFRDKLDKWSKISPKDGPGLRRLTDFMRQCKTAMSSISALNILNDERENRKMLMKLPDWVVLRWGRIVARRKVKDSEFPSFKEFVEFLEVEAEIANDPVVSLQAIKGNDNRHSSRDTRDTRNKGSARSLNTTSQSRSPKEDSTTTTRSSKASSSTDTKDKGVHDQHKVTCVLCNGKHYLNDCSSFLSKPISDRKEFITESRLCYRCLQKGHIAKECKSKLRCKICGSLHPSSLHIEGFSLNQVRDKTHSDSQSRTHMSGSSATCSNSHVQGQSSAVRMGKCSMIVPVWVTYKDAEVLTYALLDTQSDASFILEEVCDSLGADGPHVKLSLSTMHAQDTPVATRRVEGLSVRGYKGSVKINLPPVYTRSIMPADRTHIPTPEVARQWPHLQHISSHLVPIKSCKVGLLIGYNCPQALTPRDIIPADHVNASHAPFAQKTDLGWAIVGVTHIREEECDAIGFSHRIWTREVPEALNITTPNKDQVLVSCRTRVKEVFNPGQVRNILESDFMDRNISGTSPSIKDKNFVEVLTKGIHKTNDGHLEMPLPLTDNALNLPNNKVMAARRLEQLKGKFRRDPRYHHDYQAFMDKIIKGGYAERVPESELKNTAWYIPHHGVYHPKKPNKIRVVYDCSATYDGHSLNDYLLQGPDTTNSLTGILCRFRQHRVAFTCDIEQMFHQFKVDTKHRDLLRFLWWNDECQGSPVEYRMCVHLFGATSSPGCCTFAFRHLACEHQSEFGSDVMEFIHKDFYVDDGLKSLPTEKDAISLIERTRTLCSKGGLHLHKFTSNADILEDVPRKDCTTSMDAPPMMNDTNLTVENVLGMQWCTESDTFKFKISLKEKPFTRRGVLSTVGSIYDPLGLVAPFLLTGKQILQELCKNQADWDSPLPDNVLSKWEQWQGEILQLENFEVPRCYRPSHFGKTFAVELHHFSDASTTGYGYCSYLRFIDDDGEITCSLVMGKARVTPLKPITIPRLELTAATLSIKGSLFLRKELEMDGIKEFFWTDSQIVLAYIRNEDKRFHVFVGNRVQQIREHSSPDQWRYVKTDDNPADEASRGLKIDELLNKSRWLRGPEFLWKGELPENNVESTISATDPEVKQSSFFSQGSIGSHFEMERLERFSDWHKLKVAIALCLRLKENLRNRVLQKRSTSKGTQQQSVPHETVSVQEIQCAEIEIIKMVQQEVFGSEIKTLSQEIQSVDKDSHKDNSRNHGKPVKETSPLYKLDPFLDKDGVIRVGGRLRRSEMQYGVKHPVVLPKGHHVSNLIIKFCHERTRHQGRGMTINEIRNSGFWITGCSSSVSEAIWKCVTCRRLRSSFQGQKMADLPSDRLDDAPPFTYCGVDLFGPWIVKEGRKEMKRYGVLFTCLACRAIHIETATSLSTDAFINALRRMVSIRGPIRLLRCDQGTNFVGAEGELARAAKEMDDDYIKQYLQKEGCDYTFKMNTPSSSHMGGVWERQIRSTRNVLSVILKQASGQLDDESLRTFMCEAMAVVNSRPLTAENINDPSSPLPLSPNNLLTMKSRIILPPPGNFTRGDMYSRKRWRRVQHIANEFWIRWQREYLQNLQVRQKWQRPQNNLKEGDIVIVKDEGLPRCQWSLARVHKAAVGEDGLVRHVRLRMGDCCLDATGKRTSDERFLERPIHKVVLLCSEDE